MRVGIYMRVSTDQQHAENQLPELQRYAKARKWNIVQTYKDEGISGSTERRPGLNAMLKDAKARRFDTLLVWRLDRLGRSLRHLVNLLDELHSLGVGFVALNQQIDTTTAAGKLQLHLLAAFSEYEKSIIQERVRAGLARVRANGGILGRPRHPAIDKLQTVQGLSNSKAAAKLGVSLATIKRWRKEAGSKTPTKSDSVSPDLPRKMRGRKRLET